VLAYCSGMAQFVVQPPLASVPFVLDMVDVDSRKWAALSQAARPPHKWVYGYEAKCLAHFEAVAVARARATLVVNERERQALAEIAPESDIRVVGNGIDVQFFRPQSEPRREAHAVFCGVMNYEPNAEGALWLIQDIWPRVRAIVPHARLMIVGSDPRSDLRAAAVADSSVTITGRVPDVRPYLWQAAVAVAPLRTARGVQNKVLEATAAGLPSVVTPAVFEGLPAEIRPACRAVDDAKTFAAAIVEILAAPAGERDALVNRADVARLTWDRQLAALPAILADASRTSG
jgi:sugar transferase (PEP-CTERM/EpsH1 system associated)